MACHLFGSKQLPQADSVSIEPLTVWYKTKFGSQNLATNFGNHL